MRNYSNAPPESLNGMKPSNKRSQKHCGRMLIGWVMRVRVFSLALPSFYYLFVGATVFDIYINKIPSFISKGVG